MFSRFLLSFGGELKKKSSQLENVRRLGFNRFQSDFQSVFNYIFVGLFILPKRERMFKALKRKSVGRREMFTRHYSV